MNAADGLVDDTFSRFQIASAASHHPALRAMRASGAGALSTADSTAGSGGAGSDGIGDTVETALLQATIAPETTAARMASDRRDEREFERMKVRVEDSVQGGNGDPSRQESAHLANLRRPASATAPSE